MKKFLFVFVTSGVVASNIVLWKAYLDVLNTANARAVGFDELLDCCIMLAANSTLDEAPKILNDLQFLKVSKDGFAEVDLHGEDA